VGAALRGAGSVLVTGASSGIGRAAAIALDGAGFAVFAGVRGAAAAADLVDAASRAAAERGGSSRLRCVELDVTDGAAIAAAAAAIEHGLERDAGGGPGFAGLLANAGISVNAPLELLALAELRRQLEVNVIGQLAVVQAFLPLLRRDRGRIVLTGSVSGFLAMPFVGAYCMSKHALEAMADALRMELLPWEIQVSLLQPGQVRTAIWEKGRRDAAALLAADPAPLRELYGERIGAALRLAERAERSGTSPEAIADVVVHAFTSRRPRARYLAGGYARTQRILAMIPDRLRDRVMSRLLGG
jgi:NAD(P)-dependent dehydrogenase (short-subunit alcohol dehydrogenase family)